MLGPKLRDMVIQGTIPRSENGLPRRCSHWAHLAGCEVRNGWDGGVVEDQGVGKVHSWHGSLFWRGILGWFLEIDWMIHDDSMLHPNISSNKYLAANATGPQPNKRSPQRTEATSAKSVATYENRNGMEFQCNCGASLTLGKQQADPCKWKALIRKKYLDHSMDITWCYPKNGAFNWFDQRIRWSSPTSRLSQSETQTGWWKSVTDLWIGFQS